MAAVGNIGLNAGKLAYPARLENVIAVGGLTRTLWSPTTVEHSRSN